MLSDMPRINIRSTQAMIDMQTQLGSLSSHMRPAQLSGRYRAPRCNIGATQARIDIDSYKSRHSYGYTDHTDFAAEAEQDGLQKAAAGQSRRTESAWDNIENGAKHGGGNIIVSQAKQLLQQQISQQRYIVAQAIPAPTINVTPARLEGDNDRGDISLDITTSPMADVSYQPGKVETYVKQKAAVRQWVSFGQYDILA